VDQFDTPGLSEIRFGRKPKLTSYQRQEALERLAAGESQLAIAGTMGINRVLSAGFKYSYKQRSSIPLSC
jgi:hypothetical protein